MKLNPLVTLNTENIRGVTMTHPQNVEGIKSQKVFQKSDNTIVLKEVKQPF